MKKTGCKAAMLILLAVLVLSGEAFAGRGGGRGRRRGPGFERDIPDGPRMGARAGVKRPGRDVIGRGPCCPLCQRPCVWGQYLQGRGMIGGRGRGLQGRGLGPCGQGLGLRGMIGGRGQGLQGRGPGLFGQGFGRGGMMQGRGMMGGPGRGFQGGGMGLPGQGPGRRGMMQGKGMIGGRGQGMRGRGLGGPGFGMMQPPPILDDSESPIAPEDIDQPAPPVMGGRGQAFWGRGMGRRGQDFWGPVPELDDKDEDMDKDIRPEAGDRGWRRRPRDERQEPER